MRRGAASGGYQSRHATFIENSHTKECIVFDQPFVRPSPLQAIDPRVRLALAALTAVCLALLQNLTACWLGLA